MSLVEDRSTAGVTIDRATGARQVRRFRLHGQPPEPRSWEISSARCSIGAHPSNDVVLAGRTVSRFHCELILDEAGLRVRDLESRNGTFVDGVRLLDGFLKDGSELSLGRTSLRLQLEEKRVTLPVSERSEFGSLVGTSPAMRSVFAMLEQAAQSSVTVLIEGETGTGKEGAAEALHTQGPRRDNPLVVVDCGSLPATLIESELFGHEKGSFTGSAARRVGAFEEADGGTIFLDEVGELPLALQPKLLRVLERKEIRRVGANAMQPLDVRVVAATNRDLRTQVNRGDFRPDLYFRLAVLRIELPPLRQRLNDIPLLVERMLGQLGVDAKTAEALQDPEFFSGLMRASWPGNVRELRNHLERCATFQRALPVEGTAPIAAAAPEASATPRALPEPYSVARRRALDEFERQYLTSILARHGDRVSQAALEARVDRVYLYRLLRRHGLTP